MYQDTFDRLPVAAQVNGQYLAVHGGISERLTSLSDINMIDRQMEPEDDTLLADLLWADPARNKECNQFDYVYNEERNISCYFGKAPLLKLLGKEKLKALVRAHQL